MFIRQIWILLSFINLFAFFTTVNSQNKSVTTIPHLEKRGVVTQLVVDGKPWLSLAGELLNNAASTAENAKPVWAKLAKANLNTVLVAVSWSWIEPEEGTYDFTELDKVLNDARSNKLRVVLLWFGSWKNGTSSYTPAWVKRNWEKYPIARYKDGKGMEILSTMSATNRDADARAYAALMKHVREVDSATRTVIMIQLENEVGLIGDSRDFCKEANEAFAGPVPQELMDYLQKNKNTLLPETRKLWDDAGGKISGTWKEVFGNNLDADNAFMAWHYALYMNQVAKMGKKEYPLPIFVNAWLKQPMYPSPGNYPSGGPEAHNHDFWRAGAPQIDVLAPDIYVENFAEVALEYSRGGNPLFIPETRDDPANAFYAIGQLNAQMFSPFGIERQVKEDCPLAQAYDVLGQLAPLIMEHQSKGTIKAVLLEASWGPQQVQLGNYVFEFTMSRGRGGQVQPESRGYAILIQTGPNDFWVAGANLNIMFSSSVEATPMASLATVQEGRFENGAWVVGRHLAGDDTGMGDGKRASLRLKANPGILRFSLYSYR
jgi:beta-galactosidase GanA